jgi:hypothetical protein
LCSTTPAGAQVSIGIGLPSVSIGINLSSYPQLVPLPNYPVYYAPSLASNYFFYDGMYWVYQDDNWYASDWYNGPWGLVGPEAVPLFVLRIPVRYYRNPPSYFRPWRPDAPPRWGEHWGNGWEQRHSGWDRWNRRAVPAPAPLPVYQRRFSGDRYPPPEQQRDIRGQNYRYQPRDAAVKPRYQQPQQPPVHGAPARDAPSASRPPPPQMHGEDPRKRPPPEPGRAQSQRQGQGPENKRDEGDDRRQERR